MNLLVLTQNYPPSKGGMSESCGRIVRNLKKNFPSVHVLHFTNRTEPFVLKKETKGYYAALGIEDSEEFTLNLAQLFLESKEKILRFDAILAFGGYLPLIWAPVLSKFSGKPFYVSIRGNDFDEALFSKRRPFLFEALRNATAVLSVTEEKKIKIQKLFPDQKVHFTPNGIEADFWKISAAEKKQVALLQEQTEGKKIILIAGQLKSKKGLSIFIKNFTHFPFKDQYVLWLIGDISIHLKEEIEAFDIEVNFISFVEKYEMRYYYRAADLVCIPSLYDGMPNVLLEAGACEKFVLATTVGGIPNVITHGENGFLYDPLEKNALLQNLLEIHTLSLEKKEMVASGLYRTIVETFTEEKEINNYLTIFKP